MYKINEKTLRRLMIQQKLNASDLARMSGLRVLTVSKLLKGGQVALLSTVGKIADALHIDGEELILE